MHESELIIQNMHHAQVCSTHVTARLRVLVCYKWNFHRMSELFIWRFNISILWKCTWLHVSNNRINKIEQINIWTELNWTELMRSKPEFRTFTYSGLIHSDEINNWQELNLKYKWTLKQKLTDSTDSTDSTASMWNTMIWHAWRMADVEDMHVLFKNGIHQFLSLGSYRYAFMHACINVCMLKLWSFAWQYELDFGTYCILLIKWMSEWTNEINRMNFWTTTFEYYKRCSKCFQHVP